jgi:hypothetical protein
MSAVYSVSPSLFASHTLITTQTTTVTTTIFLPREALVDGRETVPLHATATVDV